MFLKNIQKNISRKTDFSEYTNFFTNKNVQNIYYE
jgi:hypothetical protein